jgi:3-hydroxyacyl-[acyl-carrier-protein] dehydratase
MLLEHKYYDIVASEQESPLKATYTIHLRPDCAVYAGHFPGNPVCPGVCNMETIRECAMMLTGRQLHFSEIKQCRLTAVATPVACPTLTVSLTLTPASEDFSIQAAISNQTQTYMQLKGTLVADALQHLQQ